MSEKESVSVSGILDPEEIKKAQLNQLRLLVILTPIISYAIAVPVLFLGVRDAFSGVSVVADLWLFELLIALIVALLIPLFAYIWIRLLLGKRVHAEYKSNQQLKNEVIFTFSDDGINQNKFQANSFYEWDDILSFYEYQDMYLLYVSRFSAIILPKRFFKTKTKKERFEHIIHEKMITQKTKWL